MSASAMGLMGGVHQNRALLATGTTLLVAYSNHSISGGPDVLVVPSIISFLCLPERCNRCCS